MSDWKVPVSMVNQAKEITRLQAENDALRVRVAELQKMMDAIKAAAGYRWMSGISDHKLLSDIEKMTDNATRPTDSGQEP